MTRKRRWISHREASEGLSHMAGEMKKREFKAEGYVMLVNGKWCHTVDQLAHVLTDGRPGVQVRR